MDSSPATYTIKKGIFDQYIFHGYVQQNGASYGDVRGNGVYMEISVTSVDPLAAGQRYPTGGLGVDNSIYGESQHNLWVNRGDITIVSVSDKQIVFDVSSDEYYSSGGFSSYKGQVTGRVTFNNYRKDF